MNHDLYPYFREVLDRHVDKLPFIIIMFDESLNEIFQQNEMDVFVCFWDIDRHKVCSWFYDSRFLGHTTHLDVLSSLEDSVKKIDATRMIQVSTDGPNTNLKFLEEYQKKRVQGELPQFIDIGTCNPHTVRVAFETGVTKRGWNLRKLLKGAHRILRDTPAQREDYFNLTGYSKFPLPFVATRWVEDKGVPDRLIELWDNIKKVFDFWEGLAKSKRPKSKSYENVKARISDPLALAKLKFFSFVASLLEPYLLSIKVMGLCYHL